ncbi:MAG: 1,4-dihydroxy-6-naphthoate synthase [Flavobacteriales bacterium]|nr:1,4-dihydroxy-6-naphthoate synthase [Flavobacteriales bacterium]
MSRDSISIGFSPCPNDTFIFDALIHNKIDTEGLIFEPVIADVEELNRKASAQELDVSKLSFHAFLNITDKYILLRSGSALGNNCGPILISKDVYTVKDVSALKIAIPGKFTTANYLLHHAFPSIKDVEEMLFSDIEGAILKGEVDAGLIIHENRFTYLDKGFNKILDLGEYWESITSMPIPLGGIAVSRDIDINVQKKINRVLNRSVQFAMKNPEESRAYIKLHSQELGDKIVEQHIALYVNHYTLDLGEMGEKAISLMLRDGLEQKILPKSNIDDIILSL